VERIIGLLITGFAARAIALVLAVVIGLTAAETISETFGAINEAVEALP